MSNARPPGCVSVLPAQMVEQNSGLNDVIAQPMWVNSAGGWRFMSLCTQLAFITDAPCNQVLNFSETMLTGFCSLEYRSRTVVDGSSVLTFWMGLVKT